MEITDLSVCADCLPVIVNGDATGLDYYYEPEEAQEKLDAITGGMEALTGEYGNLCGGDSEQDIEFSSMVCDCCGTELAGSRYHIVALKSK